MANNKKRKIDIFRLCVGCFCACFAMAMALSFHTGKVQETIAKLVEKGKLSNVEWVVEHLSYCLPVVLVALVIAAVYSIMKSGTAENKQSEMTIVSMVVIVFTYAIMLPFVFSKKEPIEDSEKTLIDISIKWFFFQLVPLIVLALYHGSRAEYERKLALSPEVESAPVTTESGAKAKE